MLRMIHPIVSAMFVSVLLAAPAVAQTPDQERIKQLELENNELRQELAQLRLELSQLKRELAKHKPAAEKKPAAGEADPGETDETSDSPEDGKEGESKDKNKPRAFRSADEIYRSIPQDLRPARDGWDIVERRTVENWLKTNITGKRFEARKKVSKVEVDYDAIKQIWEVTLLFEHEEMRYMSWEMEEHVYGVVLRGDKAFAENARKKYKTGGTVNVSGTISQINWDIFITQNAEKNWHPTHCKLALEGVQIK